MKIVDYETFIRMPPGTIFAPYEPCIFKDSFQIKVDGGHETENPWTDEKHWYFNGTMPLDPWFKNDDDFAFDYGTYETEMCVYDGDSTDASSHKMFAVLESHEVKRLVNALHWALNGCAGGFDECEKE